MGRTRRQKRRDDVFRPTKKDFDSAPPNVMHRERIYMNNEKTTELTEHCAAELAVDVTRYFDAAFKYDRQKHEQ
jgi:hypothetical protein